MNRAERVKEVTKGYYEKENPVIDWNKWVFEGHNEVVAKWVKEIAKRHQFDLESTLIAVYLHDIAYSWTSKNDPSYEEQSLAKAREILEEESFAPKEIAFIVEDILLGHGAHEGGKLEPIEARVLATADALAHLTTDFFLVMCWHHYLFEGRNLDEYKEWVLEKIERDFNNKIFFAELRGKAKPHYEALKRVFGSEATERNSL